METTMDRGWSKIFNFFIRRSKKKQQSQKRTRQPTHQRPRKKLSLPPPDQMFTEYGDGIRENQLRDVCLQLMNNDQFDESHAYSDAADEIADVVTHPPC